MTAVLFITLSLVLPALCHAERPVNEYLPESIATPFEENEIKWIIGQIENLESSDSDEIDNFLRKASTVAEELAKGVYDYSKVDDTQVSQYEKSRVVALGDMLNTFLELIAAPDKDHCSSRSMQQYFDILRVGFGTVGNFLDLIASDSPKQNRIFFHYIKNRVRNNLRECVELVDLRFQEFEHRVPIEVEAELDNLFSLGKLDRAADELAQQVDFVGGEFKAKKMLNVIRNSSDGLEYDKKNSHMAIVGHLLGVCPKIRVILAEVFDSYNFGRAMWRTLDSSTHNYRFKKLNEYSRICNQVLNPSTRGIVISNIQDKLNDEHWYNRLMRKGSVAH